MDKMLLVAHKTKNIYTSSTAYCEGVRRANEEQQGEISCVKCIE